ncbi:MAG: MFS transporter [Erysipelotrichaceae bacterium]|nr:MFS transporter [Erysipelotrichaceae bacterium]
MNDVMKKRPLYLLNGFIGFLFLGICNAWSIFVVPLETAFNYTRSQTSLAYTICIAGFSIGAILAGSLNGKLKVNWLMRIAAVMIGIGLFFTGFAHNILQIYVTYSVICGVGIGLGYALLISTIPLWFPEKSGTISGICLMGYALSTAIFGTLINILLNAVGIQNTFRILGIISLVGLMLITIVLRAPTLHERDKLPEPKGKIKAQTREIPANQMLKNPIFYVYFIAICACGGSGLAIINHASPIMTEELMATSAFAASIVSINSIANGVARMGWGIVFDKLGTVKTLLAAYFFGIIAGVVLVIALLTKSVPLFMIGGILIMIAFGGNASLLPNVVRDLFGNANFSMNYSIFNLNALVCSFVPTIVGLIQSATHGYTIPIIFILVLEAVTVGLSFVFATLYKQFTKTA